MSRDSFIFYRSFFEAIDELEEKNQLELYRSISIYSLNFEEPDLKGLSKTIWTLIKPQLTANNRKYENGCKGADHGKKGGRPTITPKKPLANPTVTPNDNVNDNVNVNDKINWKKLLSKFNEITGKKSKVVPDKVKHQIQARLKEGYTKDDIVKAIENCYKDPYHKDNNHRYLTLEFISRSDKLDKFLNTSATTIKLPTYAKDWRQ